MNNNNNNNLLCTTICIISTIYLLYDNNNLKRKISVLYDNVYEVNDKCDKNKELSINISKEIRFTNKEWQQEIVRDELEKVLLHHFPEPMELCDDEDYIQHVVTDE